MMHFTADIILRIMRPALNQPTTIIQITQDILLPDIILMTKNRAGGNFGKIQRIITDTGFGSIYNI